MVTQLIKIFVTKFVNKIAKLSPLAFHRLTSSIFPCLFVFLSSVTSPLFFNIWQLVPCKPYIFCNDKILATCQRHYIPIWWLSYHHMMIIISYSTKVPTCAVRGAKEISYFLEKLWMGGGGVSPNRKFPYLKKCYFCIFSQKGGGSHLFQKDVIIKTGDFWTFLPKGGGIAQSIEISS